jgi:hypothetical protein
MLIVRELREEKRELLLNGYRVLVYKMKVMEMVAQQYEYQDY